MKDAYIIRDDYDQTTKAIVLGTDNAEEALSIAKADLVTGEGDLYAVGPIHIITKPNELEDKCPECAAEFSDDVDDTESALLDKEAWPFGRMPKLKGCEACNPLGY
jgi:hypothetical protein